MTTKRTIRKYAVSSLGNEVALPWMIFEPGVIPPKLFHEAYWAACAMGETFDEVLAYVEFQIRKTRTVEVELPKVVRKAYIDPRPFAEMAVIDKGEHGVQILFSDDHFRLLNSDLKPLGEYLLALHYEKENK